MNPQNTPRTDAVTEALQQFNASYALEAMTEHAQRLERELNELQEQVDEWYRIASE